MIDSIFSAKKISEADVVIVSAGYEKTTSAEKNAISMRKLALESMKAKLK